MVSKQSRPSVGDGASFTGGSDAGVGKWTPIQHDGYAASSHSSPAYSAESLPITPLDYGRNSDAGKYLAVTPIAYDSAVSNRPSSQSTDKGLDLYAYGGKDNTSGTFDPKKSVADLIQAGDIQSRVGSDNPNDHPVLPDGQVPKISVQYQDLDANVPNKPKPDFIVQKDGTITAVNNPEGPDGKIKSNIVIEVARDRGDVDKPTAAQQQALESLVNYEAQRVEDQNSAALKTLPLKDGTNVKQVDIEDPQKLVSDNTMRKYGERVPDSQLASNAQPTPDVQQPAQRTSGQVGRVGGSDGGSSVVPSDQSNETYQNQAPVGDTPQAAMTDTIGALNGDKTHPYETVHRQNDGTYNVGRYGFNHHNFSHFLGGFLPKDIMALLGDPPDWSKLAEILKNPAMQAEFNGAMDQAAKDGKVPQDFAKSMKDPANVKGFGDMLEQMNGKGPAPTAAQLDKYLPKGTQDTIAQSMVNGYAKEMNIDPTKMGKDDPGKLALAMYLGHAPSQTDLGNPSYKDYMTAADNLNNVSQARQQGNGDVLLHGANGQVAAVAANLVGQQLWAQTPWAGATNHGRLGCAASVSVVMEKSGYDYIKSASVMGVAQQAESHGWKQTAGIAGAQPGDIIYGERGGDGHIGIVGNNGTLYDNFSSDGKWHQEKLASSYIVRHFGSAVRTLHQPA